MSTPDIDERQKQVREHALKLVEIGAQMAVIVRHNDTRDMPEFTKLERAMDATVNTLIEMLCATPT